jgi:hypothetical protein
MRDLIELVRFEQPWPEHIYGPRSRLEYQAGVYVVPSPVDRADLRIIASDSPDWEHVSVSRAKRPPNWAEMEAVFRLFFNEGETAMQFHVPRAEHVNIHPNTLHIWRPKKAPIPKPPRELV